MNGHKNGSEAESCASKTKFVTYVMYDVNSLSNGLPDSPISLKFHQDLKPGINQTLIEVAVMLNYRESRFRRWK